MKQIKTIKALEAVLKDGEPHEFALMLTGGAVFSRKTITKSQTILPYKVFNHIDETQQYLDAAELKKPKSSITNIGEAMRKGAFYLLD